MLISKSFDSGSIDVIDVADILNIRLRILLDHESDFFQWFHFRASGVLEERCNFIIERANETAFPERWENYNVCASYDRDDWFRMPSVYDGESLNWSITLDETASISSISCSIRWHDIWISALTAAPALSEVPFTGPYTGWPRSGHA